MITEAELNELRLALRAANDKVGRLVRERDEALHSAERLSRELDQALRLGELLIKERDEARAAVERYRAALEQTLKALSE